MNYAELNALIQGMSEYAETDFVAAIPDFVRNAEERIFRTVELPCARVSATGSLTNNVQTLAHGLTDLFWPHYLTITVSGAPRALLNKESDWIIEAYSGAATGVPACYAFKSDTTLMFGPTPNSNYAYELVYHGLPQSIVTASTSWLGTHARNALLYGSLVEAGLYMRQDDDLLMKYETHYQEAITQLAEQGRLRIRRDAFRMRDKRPVE